MHPLISGNVVTGWPPARQGYPTTRGYCISAQGPHRKAARISSPLGRAARHRPLGAAAEPTIVEVVIKGAGGGRQVPPGPVLPGCRTSIRCSRLGRADPAAYRGLAMTGAWVDADRGLGSCIVMEMGGLVTWSAGAQPGRSRDLMGRRNADPHRKRRNGVAGRRGPGASGAVFDSGRRSGRVAPRRAVLAGTRSIDRSKSSSTRDRKPPRRSCLVLRRGRGFAPRSTQDRAFREAHREAMEATRPALGRSRAPHREADRSSRCARTGCEGGQGEPTTCQANLSRDHARSDRSPRRCRHDEAALRQCMQVHRDVRTRQKRGVSCLQRTSPLDAVDFGSLNERLKAEAHCRKGHAKWLEAMSARSD